MRAVIYSRISEADGDAMGVGRQVDLCKAEIERRGWELVGVYEDNDISAVGKTRPEYDMLLRDLPSGAFDVVVATEQSRISRDEDGTWVNFRDAYLAAGLSIVDFGGNLIDVASPMGKALSSVSNTMATLERDTLIKRVQAKHQELADRGFWSGGNRPFGYRPVKVTVDGYTGTSLVVDPAEAALIREAVETIKTTGNLMKLARDWNARGIPSIAAELPRMTKKGKPRKASGLWSPTSLRRMLTNPILIGLRTHNGDTVPALWEPILTVAESEAIGKILSASTRRSVLKATKVDFDLRGVLICGNCGRKLEPEYRNGGQPWYGCHSGQHRGCGKVFVSKGNVEAVVLGRLLRLVDDPRIRSIIQASAGAEADEAQRLMIENADDEKMLAEWADMLSKRETDRATYVRQTTTIRADIDARLSRLSTMTGTSAVLRLGMGGSITNQWKGLSDEDKRAVLLTLVQGVEVMPVGRRGSHFSDERLHFLWTNEAFDVLSQEPYSLPKQDDFGAKGAQDYQQPPVQL